METVKASGGGDESRCRFGGYAYSLVRKYKNHIKWKCVKSGGKHKCPGMLRTSLNANDAVLKHGHNHGPKAVGEKIECFRKNGRIEKRRACEQRAPHGDTPPRASSARCSRRSPMAVIEERSAEESSERSVRTDRDSNRPRRTVPMPVEWRSNAGKHVTDDIISSAEIT